VNIDASIKYFAPFWSVGVVFRIFDDCINFVTGKTFLWRMTMIKPKTTKKLNGFTLIELLVVISIIALLISILMPALNKAREQATGAVCLGNQKTLVLAWMMYADENDDKLVYGSVHEYTDVRKFMLAVQPPMRVMNLSLSNNEIYPAYAETTQADRERGIQAGKLYKYINTVEVYHCPGDKRNIKNPPPSDVYRSYSIPHGLAGSFTWSHIKLSTIKRPSSKYVFVEEWQSGMDYAYNSSAWALRFFADSWQDPLAIWHNKRSTLSFADGHAEMHGWIDEGTIELSSPAAADWAWNDPRKTQSGNPDLEYMIRGFAHLNLSSYGYTGYGRY